MLLSQSEFIHKLKKMAHSLKKQSGDYEGFQQSLDKVALNFGYASWFELNKNFDMTFVAHRKYADRSIIGAALNTYVPEKFDGFSPLLLSLKNEYNSLVNSVGNEELENPYRLMKVVLSKLLPPEHKPSEEIIDNLERMFAADWDSSGEWNEFDHCKDVHVEFKASDVMIAYTDLMSKPAHKYPNAEFSFEEFVQWYTSAIASSFPCETFVNGGYKPTSELIRKVEKVIEPLYAFICENRVDIISNMQKYRSDLWREIAAKYLIDSKQSPTTHPFNPYQGLVICRKKDQQHNEKYYKFLESHKDTNKYSIEDFVFKHETRGNKLLIPIG